MALTAIIAGSTGFVGSELVKILADSPAYSSIKLLVRKKTDFSHPKISEVIVDFDQLDLFQEQIKGDVVFSCLGSTRKKTPDQNIYYKIDHDYPVKIGQIALKNGASQFHLVSAVGANAGSSTFYIRLKGETERDIAALSFQSLYIYRPSMITGNRKETRTMEKAFIYLFKFMDFLLFGPLRKFRSVSAPRIASSMYKMSVSPEPGIFYIESDQINDLAKGK